MATFIEIQTDAFADRLEEQRDARRWDYAGVRRPYRGIEIKEDTYGIMKVIRADGTEIPLTDAGGEVRPQSGNRTSAGGTVPSRSAKAGGASTYNYSNFVIQRIDESRQEKSQILETFGDTYIFFFGERPRLLNVSGLLMNTLDFNWRTEFWFNYENHLRGTKLVEQNARIYLHWDDIVVEGYMLQAQARDEAEAPYHIPFSFTMFVTNHIYLSSVGDEAYPITHAVNLQPLLKMTDAETAKRELKAGVISAEKYVSSVDAVRKEAQKSESARQASLTNQLAPLGQALSAGKQTMVNALQLAVHASDLTFLSIANHYFRQRKVRFPRGIAGAESYAGPPQLANQPNTFDFYPKRSKPIRSNIRDNVDEYVGSGVTGWEGKAEFDRDAILRAQEQAQFKDPYFLEIRALGDLNAVGVDPIQHPGGSPFERAHDFAVAGAIVASAVNRFGISGPIPLREITLGF